MQAREIFDHLAAGLGDAVYDFQEAQGKPTNPKEQGGAKDASCKVKPERLADVARVARDDERLRFDFLQCVTAVDYLKQQQLQVVYHLYSYPLRHAFVLKVDLPREQPVVPSVAALWKTADWQEREQFDLLGVAFSGHPDLRRLLMPDDWVGHPMRKDFKEADSYREMPTTRPSPLDLLVAFDKEGRTPVVVGAPGPTDAGLPAVAAAAAAAKE